MRHEATVTATVDGSTNSVSVSVTALASDGGVGKNSRSCAVLARDAARQVRSSDPEKDGRGLSCGQAS